MEEIKRHSTFPYLEFYFTDMENNPIDGSAYQIKLLVKDMDRNVVIDAIVGEADSGAVWVDEEQGVGEYRWQDGDTDTLGTYKYEFEFLRLADQKEFTLPKSGFFTYHVREDIESESVV